MSLMPAQPTPPTIVFAAVIPPAHRVLTGHDLSPGDRTEPDIGAADVVVYDGRSAVQAGGGNRAIQCRAMSSRRQTQTWLWPRMCSIKRISAVARPGW